MESVLANLPKNTHPNLLVGYNTADDAGVYQISDDTALVQTVDFFPPIVDDGYNFGRIAAANALSDVYAMGGRPITALSIVGFPSNLPAQILTDILRGGNEKIQEAGAVLVGGHSIKDNELKYGVSVTGLVHPKKVLTNSNAKVGDRLYLTKRLGTGLITTGIKRNAVSETTIEMVVEQMATLNKDAAEVMVNHAPNAVTDITGYGLLGHAYEMANGSGVSIRLHAHKLPILPDAIDCAKKLMIPGGANANREFLEGKVSIDSSIDANIVHVMFDPQTSGGLFISIPTANAEGFEKEMQEKNIFCVHVGEVVEKGEFSIEVL